MSSFAPQTANSSPGARQAYLQSNRADGSQAVFGTLASSVNHFGLDLVSMRHQQYRSFSTLRKLHNQSCMSISVQLRTSMLASLEYTTTPLSRPACAVRVALQRVSHKCLNFTEATCRNVQFCSTLPALGSAAARNYCKLTGLTWARRRVSAWHGRQCAGSCKAAVRFGGLSSWACFWQVLAKRQWKAQLSAEHESQQKFWSL